MVRNTLVNRGERALFLGFFIISLLASAIPSVLLAQQQGSSDYEPPIIEYTSPDAGALGGVEVFSATVVDNEEIKAVSLLYRFSGERQFAELPMREIASSSFYSVKVDTANVPLNTKAIEYYLRAEDISGNIVLKGFAFQPLIRTFSVVEPAIEPELASEASTDSEVPLAARTGKVNWVYVAVGVLLVGGVAAAVSGDSGGGDSAIEADCCTVNVTFGRL